MHVSCHLLILGGKFYWKSVKTFILPKMDALVEETVIKNSNKFWLFSVLMYSMHHKLLPFLDLCSNTEMVLIYTLIAFSSP